MKTLKAIFVTISFLISITAFAGQDTPLPVIIDLDAGQAQGAMWTARSSDDANQMIGGARSVDEYPFPYDDYGYCHARDADGVFVGCTVYDPKYLDVISSINAYSFIRFSFDGVPVVYSNCTSLVVSAKSAYLPVKPDPQRQIK